MMLKHIENLKQEEIKAAQEKKARAKVMMGEVEVSNKAAITVKESKKKEEKDLEQKIVDYNKSKAQREEEEL